MTGRQNVRAAAMKHVALAGKSPRAEPVLQSQDYVQAAALCLRSSIDAPHVLLVTSLDTGRWILPKGWPMDGLTLAQAALQEAWEEAGIRGRVHDTALGVYSYSKITRSGAALTCQCSVYRVDVASMGTEFPEKGRRKRAWLTPSDAADRVDEPGLKDILRGI